jgi:hypothetical protein
MAWMSARHRSPDRQANDNGAQDVLWRPGAHR